jgi:hypothetical protein
MSAVLWWKRCAWEVVRWVQQGRIGWLGLTVGLLLFVVLHRILPLELERRLAWEGMIFQLVGLGLAAIGIGKLRRYFKLDPVLKSILRYFADFRFVFIARPLKARSQSAGGALVGAPVLYTPPTGTLQERLSLVEGQGKSLQLSLGDLRNKLTEVERGHIAAIQQEASMRQAGDTTGEVKLKETATGDWPLQVVGLCYFGVGIILGTVPADIARLMLCAGFS